MEIDGIGYLDVLGTAFHNVDGLLLHVEYEGTIIGGGGETGLGGILVSAADEFQVKGLGGLNTA